MFALPETLVPKSERGAEVAGRDGIEDDLGRNGKEDNESGRHNKEGREGCKRCECTVRRFCMLMNISIKSYGIENRTFAG